MKRLIVALILACSAPWIIAQNYVLYSFTGVGTNVYAKAVSTDGLHWTASSPAATWPSCQNGSPCKVNSPAPTCVGGTGALCSGGNIYLVLADANDAGLTNSHIDIGLDNTTTNVVTTITTVDMSTYIAGIYTVFAPRWIPDGSNCMYIPVATGGSLSNFVTYKMCATSLTTSGATFSSPVLVTTTGITSGYDPFSLIINGTYYLIQTEFISGSGNAGFGAATCISTASSSAGPYTKQTCSNEVSSPLAALPKNGTEGPGYYQLPGTNQIVFYVENIQDSPTQIRTLQYSRCNSLPLNCYLSTPVVYSEDQSYRAGVVFPGTLSFVNGSASKGSYRKGSALK